MNEKVFRDPVHNYITVNNPIIYDLINSKEFQRLRRVKQVSTTAFTFHGAEHSRFSHCLGVYEIARRVTAIFEDKFPESWDASENLLTMVAGLLHDVGHGAYSHTFEKLFDTNHEKITQEIITNPSTEINTILRRVSPEFPEKVASVINHTYHNKQVVQLISSQIDCDRMDYLLRDSYYSGANYGQFDLNRILRVIRPIKQGIAFEYSGMHAVEDYIVSRFQMYMQVYFHPASRGMEVLLQNLLKRAKHLYQKDDYFFNKTAPNLVPFLENRADLSDYLALDDGVMNTYFQAWMTSEDSILSDLANRFINRKVLKSITFEETSRHELNDLVEPIKSVGFDPKYYTGIHVNFDLPYDIYRPEKKEPRTEINMIQKNGEIVELSTISPIVKTLTGTIYGDRRFYFPKEMMVDNDLFATYKKEFMSYISNETFVTHK